MWAERMDLFAPLCGKMLKPSAWLGFLIRDILCFLCLFWLFDWSGFWNNSGAFSDQIRAQKSRPREGTGFEMNRLGES